MACASCLWLVPRALAYALYYWLVPPALAHPSCFWHTPRALAFALCSWFAPRAFGFCLVIWPHAFCLCLMLWLSPRDIILILCCWFSYRVLDLCPVSWAVPHSAGSGTVFLCCISCIGFRLVVLLFSSFSWAVSLCSGLFSWVSAKEAKGVAMEGRRVDGYLDRVSRELGVTSCYNLGFYYCPKVTYLTSSPKRYPYLGIIIVVFVVLWSALLPPDVVLEWCCCSCYLYYCCSISN